MSGTGTGRLSTNLGSLEEIELQSSSSQGNSKGLDGRQTLADELIRRLRSYFHRYELDRLLERPHIAAIAFSGTVGMGIFVTSGELVGIAGSMGCVIAYIGAGFIIVPVMRTLAELVSIRPVSGALIDYPHTFVDEALGFAVGVTYCIANCMSMATLTSSAARTSDNFADGKGIDRKGIIGIIVGFCVITLLSNLCGVKIYGNIERVVFWLKIMLLTTVCILMILVKAGVGSLADSLDVASSNGTIHTLGARSENGYGNGNAIVPFLRFDGFKGPEDLVGGGYKTGISGSWGQFLAIWTATTLALFSCMGGDIVIVTAGEAKKPRRDLPPVTRFMYLAPLGFYFLVSILVGMNISFMNPSLYHPWGRPAADAPKISHSPIIIILSRTSVKVLPKVLNAGFMLSAYTAGNTALFTSSRTLFSLSQVYGNQWVKDTFATTNNGNTPVAAILTCSAFSFLAFLGLADPTFDQPILSLSSFFVGGICCVYASECIAFIKFKNGMKRLPPAQLDRDSEAYQAKHYRAHWQPLCAYFALFGCTMMVLFSGWPAIYLLREKRALITANKLKNDGSLIADVVGAYSGPFIFFTLYIGYKLINKTKFRHFDDFRAAYFMPEFDGEPLPRKRPLWREIMSYFIVDKYD